MEKESNKTVSLVLGSGGARGLAHIGVIRWLLEHDFNIAAISGSSIGSLIGGAYAAGQLDKLEEWMRSIDKADIWNLLDFSWKKDGLIKGEKLIDALTELVGHRQIEDLSIPYTAVAADVKHDREVWFNKGPLFDAIRASISIPFLFTPFRHNGVDLVDGGVLNPVPIAPAFGDSSNITIAVSLGALPASEEKLASLGVKSQSKNPDNSTFNWFRDNKPEDREGEEWNSYDIFMQSIDAMQNTIARQKLAAYPPNIEIGIPRNACDMLEFDQAGPIIELGYNLAANHDALQLLVSD